MTAPGQAPKGRRRRTRYASREEQLLELLAKLRRRDRRMYQAILVLLGAGVGTPVIRAIGTIVTFIANQARREGYRRAR